MEYGKLFQTKKYEKLFSQKDYQNDLKHDNRLQIQLLIDGYNLIKINLMI